MFIENIRGSLTFVLLNVCIILQWLFGKRYWLEPLAKHLCINVKISIVKLFLFTWTISLTKMFVLLYKEILGFFAYLKPKLKPLLSNSLHIVQYDSR